MSYLEYLSTTTAAMQPDPSMHRELRLQSRMAKEEKNDAGGDDYYVSGYENYVPTTVDAGPGLLYGTVTLMILLFLSIWPSVWLGRKWKKYRKARKLEKKAAEGDFNGKEAVQHPYFRSDGPSSLPSFKPSPRKDGDDGSATGSTASLDYQMHTPSPSPEKKYESPTRKEKQGTGGYVPAWKQADDQGQAENGANEKMEPNQSPKRVLLAATVSPETPKKPSPLSILKRISSKRSHRHHTSERDPHLREELNQQPKDTVFHKSEDGTGGVLIELFPTDAKDAHIHEQEQRAVQDNFFLNTVDQILDPYVNEEPNQQQKETVFHENEDGTDGVLIELFPTSVLDQRPFTPKRNQELGDKHVMEMDHGPFDEAIAEEEEDPVPEDAFHQYYLENEEDDEDKDLIKTTGATEGTSGLDSFVNETTRGWATFRTVISCDQESRKIFNIALPATYSAISSSFFSAATTALISKNLGPEAYTAYSMVGVFLGITDSLISGVGTAEYSLTAQAIGMKNYFLAGQYAQLTTVLYFIMAVPTYGVWIFVSPKLIIALGIGEEVAEITRSYVPISVFSYLVNGVACGLGKLMWSAGHGGTMTIIGTAFSVIYFLAILVATLFFDINLTAIAWTGILYGFAYGAVVFFFTKHMGWLDVYWKGLFRNLALKNWKLVAGVMKMAIPLSFGSLMANGEWNILTFFAASMGAAEVAAWSLAGAIWSVFEYAPGGLSSAAQIRISHHLGGGNPKMAKISAYKSLLYSALWSTMFTLLFWCFSAEIVNWFTSDPTLVAMLDELVPFLAVGNVMLCLGNDCYYIITAQTRPKLCTKIYFICTWFVVVPVSAFFVFGLHWGLPSILSSVILAYGTVAVCFLYVVFTSNWAKISIKILTQAAQLKKPPKEEKAEDSTSAQEMPSLV